MKYKDTEIKMLDSGSYIMGLISGIGIVIGLIWFFTELLKKKIEIKK